jgi:hypothetical protein
MRTIACTKCGGPAPYFRGRTFFLCSTCSETATRQVKRYVEGIELPGVEFAKEIGLPVGVFFQRVTRVRRSGAA